MVSLGCPKNLVDAEVMLGVLSKQDYEITMDEKDADVIIVNTCSFIKEAKQESIDAILDLAERKHDGRCHTLIVSGCLPQRYQEELAAELPEVDIFIGTGDYPRIAEILAEKNGTEGQLRYVGDPVAAVIAETRAQAQDAAEAIIVDYDPLPAVADAGEAVRPGAPQPMR